MLSNTQLVGMSGVKGHYFAESAVFALKTAEQG